MQNMQAQGQMPQQQRGYIPGQMPQQQQGYMQGNYFMPPMQGMPQYGMQGMQPFGLPQMPQMDMSGFQGMQQMHAQWDQASSHTTNGHNTKGNKQQGRNKNNNQGWGESKHSRNKDTWKSRENQAASTAGPAPGLDKAATVSKAEEVVAAVEAPDSSAVSSALTVLADARDE